MPRFAVERAFGRDVDVIIHYFKTHLSDGNVRTNHVRGNGVMETEIIGRNKGKLRPALETYIDTAGLPDFVRRGSDYRLAQDVLKMRNASIMRNLRNPLEGMYVKENHPPRVLEVL